MDAATALIGGGLRTVTDGLAMFERTEITRGDLSEFRVVLANDVVADELDVQKADGGTFGGFIEAVGCLDARECVGLTIAAWAGCFGLAVDVVGILLVAILATNRRFELKASLVTTTKS